MAQRVCPWWLWYAHASPLRRLVQDPARILQPYVENGEMALDVGCGMGFFTLPLARLVGNGGRVIAVDLQERMIRSLRRRAVKAGLSPRIETRSCTSESLGIDDLQGCVDFALAFAVFHEMPDVNAAIASISRALRVGGLLLMAEPTDHVSQADFDGTVAITKDHRLMAVDSPVIRRSRTLLLTKPPVGA